MSPRKLTKMGLYFGGGSLAIAICLVIFADAGYLFWIPVIGFLTGLALIAVALMRGWMYTVNKRVAMSDAINLCYLGEEQSEQEKV